MRPPACSLIVLMLFAGCKHDQATQPPTTITKIPQWPMFHHDPRHTGNVNTPVDEEAGPQGDTVSVSWRTAIDNPVFSSPAVGIDGTVYLGTQSSASPDSCSFYAINPDGSVKWRYTPIGTIWSSPAIGDDGSLFVGAKGGLYAFTPAGQLKWKFAEPGDVVSSPAIGKDGTVYYVTDHLKAVDPTSGSLKWQVDGKDQANSPSIGTDGTIYYSSEGTITAVTPTGKVKWKYRDTSYSILPVSAIELGYDATVYFVGGFGGTLYAIDNQGKLRWKYYIGGSGSDPCLDMEGNLFAVGGDFNNALLCIGSNGQPKWQTVLPVANAVLNVSLTIDRSSTIYIGVSDLSRQVALLAYNRADLLWQFGANIPDNGGTVVASPAIFNGSLFFAWAYRYLASSTPYLYSLR